MSLKLDMENISRWALTEELYLKVRTSAKAGQLTKLLLRR